MNKKISFRSNFSENIVFISGLSRSGKSLFCPIVSSLNNVENFHIIPLIEEILRLNSLGYIKNDVADYLIKINFNHLIYENSIGRNFNFRPKDWIFSRKIKGLVTQYGGVNSHMAIRCAELNLPAAIGCGEKKFEELKKSKMIELDCLSHTINLVN